MFRRRNVGGQDCPVMCSFRALYAEKHKYLNLAKTDNSELKGLNLFLLLILTCTETPHRKGQNFVHERDLWTTAIKKLPTSSLLCSYRCQPFKNMTFHNSTEMNFNDAR
jgi:hypothetical protein